MTDVSLRAAERAWRAQVDDDAAFDRYLLASRRAGGWLPWDAVIRLERWRRHAGFIRKWYARPLDATSGCSPREVAALEARVGVPLPVTLREWLMLAGRRRDCGPRRGQIERVPEGLQVSEGNSGEWLWLVRRAALRLDDPPICFRPATRHAPCRRMHDTLSEFLLAALLHRTVELGPTGRGGVTSEPWFTGQLLTDYPQLPLPLWRVARDEVVTLHGDADTLIQVRTRRGGSWNQTVGSAIARTPAAAERLRALDVWSPAWEEDGLGPGWDRWVEPDATA